jgi:hypothetical protein
MDDLAHLLNEVIPIELEETANSAEQYSRDFVEDESKLRRISRSVLKALGRSVPSTPGDEDDDDESDTSDTVASQLLEVNDALTKLAPQSQST